MVWAAGEGLSAPELASLAALVAKHRKVFALEGEPLGRTEVVQHDIPVAAPPIKQGVRTVSYTHLTLPTKA